MSCSVRADALCRAWRTPGVGAVSCSSSGPGRYRAPGFVSHSLVWLSMALHTSLVRACWGAKEGTARRRRWHAGGDSMSCGAAAVIHLHAVPGTIAPHSTVPMPSAWSSVWPWTRGKYVLRRPPSSLHHTQAAPACRLRSRATPGRSGCGKAPLTAWVAWARVPMGKYNNGGIQGPSSGCASPASHRHSESGGAAGTLPVCRKWGALLLGCRWRVAARLSPSAAGATGRPPRGLRQGKSWPAGQVWRSRAISSAVPVAASSGARCHMTASTAHVEKGHAPGGVYTWMVHCGCARRTRDAWSTPRTMSAARTSTIPEGSTMIPSAGPPWRPRVCKATAAWPAWATRSTASWMFTLPRAVSSRIQPSATP